MKSQYDTTQLLSLSMSYSCKSTTITEALSEYMIVIIKSTDDHCGFSIDNIIIPLSKSTGSQLNISLLLFYLLHFNISFCLFATFGEGD